jgi:membrane-bound ClpP family serine protease
MEDFDPFSIILGGIPILLGIYCFPTNEDPWFSYLLIIGGIGICWWWNKPYDKNKN